jgi:uroporphyrinogen decarboxylase
LSIEKPILSVLNGKTPSRRPIWFMRQAGRYLPEYRKVREKAGSFVSLCYSPEMASEVTLQPLRRYDLDAAIVFADILVVPHAMGCSLDFREGEGPKLSVVDSDAAVGALRPVAKSWQVEKLQQTLRLTREGLKESAALIGFCGGPWTVASYMIEGGTSDERMKAKRAAFERPQWFATLMDMLVRESVDYLCAQVEAGAEALQLFESWAGDLPWQFHEPLVYAPLREIRAKVRERAGPIPFIVFARGVGAGHLEAAARTGAEAISIEQGVDMRWAAEHAPCAIQGNLDPVLLALGGEPLDRAIDDIVAEIPRARHIFNLGHGVRQETDPAHVTQMINRVRLKDTDA